MSARAISVTDDTLDELARAVIAAGRPHGDKPFTILGEPAHVCVCPQCAAWDGLRELLEVAA